MCSLASSHGFEYVYEIPVENTFLSCSYCLCSIHWVQNSSETEANSPLCSLMTCDMLKPQLAQQESFFSVLIWFSMELDKMFLFFRHFDENLTGRLSHKDFRSCLRGLNYYLPMVEEDEPEPKFEKFLDVVDPGR